MDYKEATSWLFEQFPAYQHQGVSAYKPDLTNTIRLCELLAIDYKALKCIHVAGTNGKGSTCSYLASILTEANERVGLFTSPHILDFSERIRVNGKAISHEKVVDFCLNVKAVKLDFSPSFFEITWALAIQHFLDENCTISVIETGLGGRLDATNIVSPILSIITNIGLDHVSILGDSLEKIAFEKAGIIKPNTPVLIGERQKATENVFKEVAKKNQSEIYFSDELLDEDRGELSYLEKNKRTVFAAIKLLNNQFKITNNNIETGIEMVFHNTGFIGRFTHFSADPHVILDVAHNEAGIKELMKIIQKVKYNRLHIVFGTSADKDFYSMLDLFTKDATIHFTQFSNPRSVKIEEIAGKFDEKSLKIHFFNSIIDCYPKLQKTVNKQDIILVTGSFFLIADFLHFFSPNRL